MRINALGSLTLSPNSFPGMRKMISATSHVLTQAFHKSAIIARLAKTNTMTLFRDHVHMRTLTSS